MTRHPAPALLTVTEATQAARVAENTVRDWIARGKLPIKKAGSRVLIRRADLAAKLDVPESDLEIEVAK